MTKGDIKRFTVNILYYGTQLKEYFLLGGTNESETSTQADLTKEVKMKGKRQDPSGVRVATLVEN